MVPGAEADGGASGSGRDSEGEGDRADIEGEAKLGVATPAAGSDGGRGQPRRLARLIGAPPRAIKARRPM
jgi:hypothetical protein